MLYLASLVNIDAPEMQMMNFAFGRKDIKMVKPNNDSYGVKENV
jgi:hypothetical protein